MAIIKIGTHYDFLGTSNIRNLKSLLFKELQTGDVDTLFTLQEANLAFDTNLQSLYLSTSNGKRRVLLNSDVDGKSIIFNAFTNKLEVDINGRTYDSTFDPNDEILFWDVSANEYKKTTFGDFNATNSFLTSASFNITTGDLILNVNGQPSVITNLDNRYALQANVSETDPIFTNSPSYNISQSDIDNWNAGISSANDKYYNHTQLMPSSTWTITHGLNKHPSVTITDSSGNVIIGNIKYLNVNQVQITFSGAFTGEAKLN